LEESDLYCHHYYILEATCSLLLQSIASEVMEVFSAHVLYGGHKKSYWRTTNNTRNVSCLKELFKTYLFIFEYYTVN
jgi:hypothetical protein